MIAIEPTTAETWAEARALLATTPMTASLPIAFERVGTEANAFPTFEGAHAVSLVARDDARVIGFLHATIEERLVVRDGALVPERLLYSGDLRVAADLRRKGLAGRMIEELFTRAASAGVTRGFCLVNEGNDAVLRGIRTGAFGGLGDVARTFVTATRLVTHRPRAFAPLDRIAPTEEALAPLVSAWSARLFAPLVTARAFARLATVAPDIAWIGDRGRIAFALWDQRTRRRLRLLGSSPALAWSAAAWRILGLVTGAPRLPRAGEAWRTLDVSLIADAAAIDRNASAIAAHAFDTGAHLLNVVEAGLDPAAPPVRLGGVVRRMRTHVIPFGIGDAPSPEVPPDAHVHVDLGVP